MEILWKSTVSAKFRANLPKLCGNCAFPQNLHTRKSVEITVFFAVFGADGRFRGTIISKSCDQEVKHKKENDIKKLFPLRPSPYFDGGVLKNGDIIGAKAILFSQGEELSIYIYIYIYYISETREKKAKLAEKNM